MSRTRKLDPIEIRVLGALMEKEQTTPDQYPMTINGVIAACNQKTNRDPVMHLTETEVVEALDRLREDVLTWRSQGARVERWQHSLDRRWGLSQKTKPLMTMLLLRGPQTVGELRTRTERMYSWESVEEVEETLRQLAEGFDALVCELPRRPGQRETRFMHLESAAGDPREIEAAEAASSPAASPAQSSPVQSSPAQSSPATTAGTQTPMSSPGARRGPADEKLETLENRLEELESTVATLGEQLQELRTALGVE